MLNLRHKLQGVSLVELLVGVAILGILAAIAAPNLSSWILNAQIRTTADAIQNGLQLARGEAVHLNTLMSFQLTTTTDNFCGLSTTQSNWVVSQSINGIAGQCGSTPNPSCSAANFSGDPCIVQVRPSAEGSGSTVVVADQSTVTFNGLGRATNVPSPPSSVTISVTNPNGGTCLAVGGPMKCLNVVVSSAGQIRMCDPSLLQATNPKGC